MGKLNLSLCSSLSPLTTPQAAEIWGVSRKTGLNFVLSGGLPSLCSGLWEGAGELGWGWHKLPLELVMAVRQFRGTGNGKPWGSRQTWDKDWDTFKRWYVETKNVGWGAVMVDGRWT